MSINITGLNETQRNLNGIRERIRDNLRDALLDGGAVVEADAIKRCPVDTGNLRADIRTQVDERTANNVSISVGIRNVLYGRFVEFGTGIYAEGGNGRVAPWAWEGAGGKYAGWHMTRGQRAQPFLRPAWYGNQTAVKETIRDTLRERILKRVSR